MGLDVDKARGHRQTLGVDRPGRFRGERSAESCNLSVLDGDIGDFPRPPAAVDDNPAADQDVTTHEGRADIRRVWARRS